jgi:trimethylamine--corrinoid protein Co-methyltransferase
MELWFPDLIDRTKYSAWEAAGSKTMGDRIRERVVEILRTHEVPPLPGDVDAGIERILAAADQAAGAEQTNLL